ncbi:MAG: hypothetical protein I3273_04235 [Candidatus Moeniiplasma glomeromycotorum]|nr:hypothetical protein [Candidatus Moeniiplasma glomeromycotorum]
MAIKIFHWEPNDIINEPRKKKSFGSSPELQKMVDEIADNLPDILSPDKKSVIKSKLQECKDALIELPKTEKELKKSKELVNIWEKNREIIVEIIEGTRKSTEESKKNEKDTEKQKKLQKDISKLEEVLDEISGLHLAKSELVKLIKERIYEYGWDDAEVKNKIDKKVGKDWETIIDETTRTDFNTIKSNLLKTLAEVILDYWLTSMEEPKTRLKVIDNYLSEATETEAQEVSKSTDRASALTRLRDKCKDLKGKIEVDMDGEMEILDENNESDNRMIFFKISSKKTSFADISAIGKLSGIEKVNQVNIYFNFKEDVDNQDRKFKELKSQLEGYQNRKLVFHFDKLEDKEGKLVNIEGDETHKRIDLFYYSYTKVEVSGGIKLPEKPKEWKDIHADFDNPQLVKNWTDLLFTYEEAKDWVGSVGILPDEQNLVVWLKVVKKGEYTKPEWVLNNADMVKIRKEWLEYEIEKRLKKYKTVGFNAADEFEKRGASGHWGSDERGKNWREYLNKINSLDESAEFGYNSVRGGLFSCLTETLLPEFLARWNQKTSSKRNMKKEDILEYMNQNCSPSENSYYNQINGECQKALKKSFWNEKLSVRKNIENLPE